MGGVYGVHGAKEAWDASSLLVILPESPILSGSFAERDLQLVRHRMRLRHLLLLARLRIIIGSFAERDLPLKTVYASPPPSMGCGVCG